MYEFFEQAGFLLYQVRLWLLLLFGMAFAGIVRQILRSKKR